MTDILIVIGVFIVFLLMLGFAFFLFVVVEQEERSDG